MSDTMIVLSVVSMVLGIFSLVINVYVMGRRHGQDDMRLK